MDNQIRVGRVEVYTLAASGGVMRSPLYSMRPAVAMRHSIISVENSSWLPRSVKPTM